MECIEELINIPRLKEVFEEVKKRGDVSAVLDEIILQSKVEFNFDEDEENVLTEMEQLIKLINDNSKKINVIFSGESIFLKKKFELFLKERNFEATIEKQILFLYYFKLENKNEIKTLAAFNYRKNINDK